MEIAQVKSLTGYSRSIWSVNLRPNGPFWVDNPVTLIPGAGEKGKIFITVGIKTVSDLITQTDVQLTHIMSTTTGVSLSTLTKWYTTPLSTSTNPGHTVNCSHSPNPYLSKYGSVDWRNKVGISAFMRKYMCVTELVQKMHDHREVAFESISHEADWYFYHDALS